MQHHSKFNRTLNSIRYKNACGKLLKLPWRVCKNKTEKAFRLKDSLNLICLIG